MKRSISLEWQAPASKRERMPAELIDSGASADVAVGDGETTIDLEAQQHDSMSLLLVEVQNPQEEEDLSISAGTALQYLFLFWIMTTPATCMLIFLWVLRSAWAAALSFHLVACLLLPYLYTTTFFSRQHYVELVLLLARHPRRQLLLGCAFWVAFAGVGSAFYWLVGRLLVPNQIAIVGELGLSDDAGVAAFGVYFCVVNPLAEEVFWRGFLPHAFGRAETSLWGIAAMYASYHLVVLATLELEPVLVLTCGVLLVVVGRLFALLASVAGVGSAAMAHCAADMVVISVLLDWRYVQPTP